MTTDCTDYVVYRGDCIAVLPEISVRPQMIMADPPDGIGLNYNEFDDTPSGEYKTWLRRILFECCTWADIVWLSFNAKWLPTIGIAANALIEEKDSNWELKPCVQTFTFGQAQQKDLANCHRPLWRLRYKDAPIYPEQVRVPSWRQENGDKRADSRGRVATDVFNFPRVTGNSKQRRAWIPTQLHEGLVERCILLSTKQGDLVLDPFGGSGTTMRCCKKLGRRCITIEIDSVYAANIAKENNCQLIETEGKSP